MTTVTDRLDTQLDASVEALQEILSSQLDAVSYEDAKEFGYELLTFFEAFEEPGEQKD
ncbi:MAG TPA: hypothetical protein VJP80_02380 [Candidatus Saccharimonadales bacterium]|nr:hypothetical protein [Candidatus Saccharimonadales bacterium]